MDFMKTLLIYMTATFALAVDSAAMPSVTPEPTPAPTPTAIVSTTLPDVTATTVPEPAVTPAPETKETSAPAAEATMTPNPKYHILNTKTRGDHVRKLQERLIELGYLTGKADGVYGNQTRKAVMEFQRYNGLSRDGVAGKITQTHLFEDPNVVANPKKKAQATNTPAPTDTPEPADTPAPTDTPVPEYTPAPETATEPDGEPEAVEMSEPDSEPEAVEMSEPDELTGTEETLPDENGEEAEPAATDGPDEDNGKAEETVPAEADAADEEETADPDRIKGSVAFNDSGAPVSVLVMEDGVNISKSPRLWRIDGTVYVSLEDLAQCIEAWILTREDEHLILEAESYVVVLTADGGENTWTVDGAVAEIEDRDALTEHDGIPVSASFLEKTLKAEVIWEEEESTLIIRVLDKHLAEAID
ncbi:MAG: peptidoglycan-binding protein [Clostridia bacterium]|nr:peptidoglycan-binding protein [Clostridia bacterium]